jgi:heme exporter protein D
MNEAASYFLGFALTILGLVALAIALFTMARNERVLQRVNRRRAITTLQRRETERLRDVA